MKPSLILRSPLIMGMLPERNPIFQNLLFQNPLFYVLVSFIMFSRELYIALNNIRQRLKTICKLNINMNI